MKVYKNFVVIWTVIYLTISFVGRFTSSNKEYFPFFRWSLYSKTPNFIESPSVIVTKYRGEVFSIPKNILDLSTKHKISSVDMNLNVVNFYNKFKDSPNNLELLRSTSLLKSLPHGLFPLACLPNEQVWMPLSQDRHMNLKTEFS